jgi:hypothetical protein
VDPEKFKKLTPEQKEKFIEMAKKARDTAMGSAKTHDAVAKNAEKVKATLLKVKVIVEADRYKLNQKEQDSRKDQILEKLKTEEKEKKDKEKQ